ncbi:thioredoxin family protein [Roseisolibacter sp. H3M3-2]|uniref:thioredoxin family protein n=1 Tax=Roseisolibacter sp. H3M3-2 TaxID=3031323 RepID=UPI0023DCE52D|nr:thioredoxin family protein [Roseisolibacter sp. H3M3-2]MDF1502111.1 thioredoxin family protein [Roseisolibacter sp. H3M3-2]
MSLEARFLAAPRFSEFLAQAQKLAALWRDTYRVTRVPDEAVARAAAVPGRWHLLVLVEDWCGDAVNTVPYLARLAELSPNLDLRILGRDANPDLMDAHLAPGGARAIPVVIVLDDRFVEHGWWGSRPGELQRWFEETGRAMEKDERYRHIRTWYARDRGRSTLDEVLRIIEGATGTRRDAAA